MVQSLARDWWLLVLRGVAGVLFGLGTIFWPGISLLVLVLLFGAYALVDGVFSMLAAVQAAQHRTRWWPSALEGVAGIAAGILTLAWPQITALVLLYLIAGWALITGILEIVAAIRLRKEIENEWLLALAGVASVLFGIGTAIFPGAGALAITWLIGAYAFVVGILFIALGLKLRGLRDRPGAQAQPPVSGEVSPSKAA